MPCQSGHTPTCGLLGHGPISKNTPRGGDCGRRAGSAPGGNPTCKTRKETRRRKSKAGPLPQLPRTQKTVGRRPSVGRQSSVNRSRSGAYGHCCSATARQSSVGICVCRSSFGRRSVGRWPVGGRWVANRWSVVDPPSFVGRSLLVGFLRRRATACSLVDRRPLGGCRHHSSRRLAGNVWEPLPLGTFRGGGKHGPEVRSGNRPIRRPDMAKFSSALA